MKPPSVPRMNVLALAVALLAGLPELVSLQAWRLRERFVRR
jgi:hypothetical protein